MNPNDKDTYFLTIAAPLEQDSILIVNLNEYELNLVKFLENLSKKLITDDSTPFIEVKKLPYKNYKAHKLTHYQQRIFKEVLNANKKAYTKIKHEVAKTRKKAQNTNADGVE